MHLRSFIGAFRVSNRAIIATQSAPQAIGPYSQAVKVGNTVWISGQIPLDPSSMTIVEGDISAEAEQVFQNLKAVAEASGGTLNDAVKINISLTDLGDFDAVNAVMASYLEEPYPARACVQVAALPKGAHIEIEAVLAL
jgi:reactive intermediate/imine deaminase